MTQLRPMQVRDVHEPIARIVGEHLEGLHVPAISHGPLIRDLQSEVNDLITRAMGEATLTANQMDALRSLLALVHYDDLAREWLNMLPDEFHPNADPAARR